MGRSGGGFMIPGLTPLPYITPIPAPKLSRGY